MTGDGLTTGELAEQLGAQAEGPLDLQVTGVAAIDSAGLGDVTFITATRWARKWAASSAVAAIIPLDLEVEGHDPDRRTLLRVPDPELSMVQVLSFFAPAHHLPAVGVDAAASVDASASVAASARIGPAATVGPGASIGEQVALHGGVHVGAEASVGAGTELHSGVVIGERCSVGRNCIMHANSSLGADGFGFRPSADGTHLVKMPHIGLVEIGDDVEIGASSCVDRGKFGATRIGDGTKIDNLVQVGHNCQIGSYCVIAAGCAFGGSVTIGNWARIAAMVGIAEQVAVGDGATIGAQSGVMHDVPAGETWLGTPAHDARKTLREWASIRKLPKIIAGRAGDG